MKKSLQRIAFGLSIIAASTGVTQSMQTPMKSMTSTTHSEQHAAWIQFTRPFNPASVTDLEKPTSLESLDFKKLRIIDVQSILEGIGIDGKIAPERIEQFRTMLGTPELAMAAFREFLNNSGFQDALNPFNSLAGLDSMYRILCQTKSIAEDNALAISKFRPLASDIFFMFLDKFSSELSGHTMKTAQTSQNLKTFLKVSGLESIEDKLSICFNSEFVNSFNLRKEKVKKDIETVLRKGSVPEHSIEANASTIWSFFFQNISQNITEIRRYSDLKKYYEIISKNSIAFLKTMGFETLTHEIFSCFFQEKKSIIDTVSAHIHEQTYRNTIVSLLAAFEYKRMSVPDFLIMFNASGDYDSMVGRSPFANIHIICLDQKQESIPVPTLSFLRDSREQDFIPHIFEFNKIINHEFGHSIFSLLGLDPLRGKSPREIAFEVYELDRYEFSEKLFFPVITLEAAKKYATTMGQLELNPKELISNVQGQLVCNMWHNSAEILQEIGIIATHGMAVINLLSDFDLSIARKVPIRWTHVSSEHFQRMLKIIPHFVKEEDIKPFFYLQGVNYPTYKTEFLDSLTK